MLETDIVSRRLWPGTPSKVVLMPPIIPPAVEGRDTFGLTGLPCSLIPMRRAAVFVSRGTIAGVAVLATLIVTDLLWPGTFSNVLARSSSETVLRIEGSGNPNLSEAALLIRGLIVGVIVDAGRGLALKLDCRD